MTKKFLLDTSVFIWLMEGNKRLDREVVSVLADPENQVYVSVASIWEIIIKRKILGLKVPRDIVGGISSAHLQTLAIGAEHVLEIEKLEDFHKDPFDRMMIAQARVEKMILITSDRKFRQYKVKLIEI